MSIEHAKTDDKKPGLLDDFWRWPGEWAEEIGKAPRTVQRHRLLDLPIFFKKFAQSFSSSLAKLPATLHTVSMP